MGDAFSHVGDHYAKGKRDCGLDLRRKGIVAEDVALLEIVDKRMGQAKR